MGSEVPFMAPSIPDFDEALSQLRVFLTSLGHSPGELAWIFREDVSTRGGRALIKVPLPPGNERLARDRYEQGRGLGVGVCLEVFCRLGRALCCTCWFVRDTEESAYRLCSGREAIRGDRTPQRPSHTEQACVGHASLA
jgi:hypothetical protein